MSRIAIGSLLVAAGLAAAGCSGGHSGSAAPAPTPQQAVLLAATHAEAATSVAATFSMRIGQGASGVTMSGSMAEQVRPHLLVQANITSMEAAGASLPGGMTEIVTDRAFYLQSSLFGSIASGKSWIEMPFSSLGASGDAITQLFQQAENNSSPLAQTKLLAGATGVRKVGTGTVNGVPVTEYTGHFTIAEALAKLPARDRQAVQQATAKAGVSGGDFTIWLDDQQQVHKLILTEQGTSMSMSMTMTVTSMNQPVNIQVPAGSQVKVISAGDLGSGN